MWVECQGCLPSREVALCWWLRLFAQHLPRLSESCASCPLLRQILERLFVSPSINNHPFSSISARSALRVVEREQISSGTTVDSHPFFFGLHPSIACFATEDVDPDSFSSTTVTLRIDHVRIIALFSRRLDSTDTRVSWAWWRLISSTNHESVTCQFLRLAVDQLIRVPRFSRPLARSSCLARLILSLSRAIFEAPSGSFSSSCSILARQRSVWFAGYPIPVRVETQTLGCESTPLKHLSTEGAFSWE